MDNAPIHTPAKIRDLVESRHYKCLYLPPYSPFLNPIEEFWSKVKAGDVLVRSDFLEYLQQETAARNATILRKF